MGRFSVNLRVVVSASWSLWLGVGLLGGVLLSGCGRGTFVGRQYDDFTALYNTFHNAEKAFNKGERAFREQERTIDRTRYLTVFPVPAKAQNESDFEKAIQKSSDVLRDHPNSRWADDALLLIGKSYFYQTDYVGAAQKFREVLALEEGAREEARFWLVRTLVANEQLDAAAEVLGRAIDTTAAPESEWTARMQLLQGEVLVRRQQWPEAATSLERGLEGEVPDRAGGRASFLLGQVYETLEAGRKARGAYRRVQDYDPPYSLAFAARLSEIELQAQQGDASAALERIRDLQSDDKNLDRTGAMALVEARIHRAQGRRARARSVLRKALYDTSDEASLSKAARARLHYELATLYRDDFSDFTRASAHFDTASTNVQEEAEQVEGLQQRLPTAPTNVGAQADQYRTLADQAATVTRLDSLLRIGALSDAAFRDFVEKKRQEKRAEQKQARQDASDPSRQLQARGPSPEKRRANPNPVVQTRDSDAGFLFYKEPARVQRGRRRFESLWGDRPRVDNWRRRNAMGRGAEDAEADPEEAVAEAASATGTSQSDEEARLDLSAIPRDSSSRAEMEAERAVARYKFGNALFLAAGRPDSAATWYRRVLEEDGDQPVARRALYALAEVYWEQGDTTAARQAYERLVDRHPDSDLAARARLRLGQRPGASSAPASAARADSAYGRAYRQWDEGAWQSALDGFLTVAQQYPNTEAAPRALLAAGVIYWHRMQADSTVVPQARVDRYVRSVQADSAATGVPGGASTLDSTASRRRPAVADSDTTTGGQGASAGPGGAGEEGANATRLDSAQVDSVEVDSVGVDAVKADSSGRDSKQASRDSSRRSLRRLLRHLTQTYADAPQHQRAQSLLTLLKERTAEADSLSPDSVLADPDQGREGKERAPRPSASDSASTDEPETPSPSRPKRPAEKTDDEAEPLPGP